MGVDLGLLLRTDTDEETRTTEKITH